MGERRQAMPRILKVIGSTILLTAFLAAGALLVGTALDSNGEEAQIRHILDRRARAINGQPYEWHRLEQTMKLPNLGEVWEADVEWNGFSQDLHLAVFYQDGQVQFVKIISQ
jgi:hypothetical protein